MIRLLSYFLMQFETLHNDLKKNEENRQIESTLKIALSNSLTEFFVNKTISSRTPPKHAGK